MKENIKIIIAEDNIPFLEGIKFLLKKHPEFIIIDECHNGKKLVESPLLSNADLILSDIEMPLMNGLQAARLINYRRSNLPMIALTMHFDNVLLEDIIQAGFKGFIHKPDIAQNLISVINTVLDNEFSFPNKLINK